MNYPVKTGIIMMVDALGIRNADISQAQAFLHFRDLIIQELLWTKNQLLKTLTNPLVNNHLKVNNIDPNQYDYEITTFGDTFILSFECTGEEERLLSGSTQLFGRIIKIGIKQGILLRGAISSGEYLKDQVTLVGPAISDVAEWYEQAQWSGLIFTPELSEKFEGFSQQKISNEFTYQPIKYQVPFKDRLKTLYTIPWPLEYIGSSAEYSGLSVEDFYSSFAKIPLPTDVKTKEEAELKRKNTMDYFNWCKDNINF